MKTPPEVLFERHASAQSKLDAIRRNVVAQFANPPESWRARVIREFVWPVRWHLAGMTAVWMLVALLHFERPSAPPALVTENKTPREFLVALIENRRQLAEMTDVAATDVAPAPQPFVPRRRSEVQPACAVV